jgi:hypothetical protein
VVKDATNHRNVMAAAIENTNNAVMVAQEVLASDHHHRCHHHVVAHVTVAMMTSLFMFSILRTKNFVVRRVVPRVVPFHRIKIDLVIWVP